MTLCLIRGSAFELEGERFRAIRHEPEERRWWVIRLSEQATVVPQTISTDSISTALEAGRCRVLTGSEDPRCRRPERLLTKAEREGQDRNIAIVERLLEDESGFLDPATRVLRIAAVAAEFHVTTEWVRMLITRFYHYGQDWSAVLPQHAKQGGPGRSRKSPRSAAHELTAEDLVNVSQIAKEYFSTRKNRPHSIRDAYAMLLSTYYAETSKRNDNGFTVEIAFRTHPTYWQFRYLINKIGADPIVRARRYGRAIITSKRRPRTGRANIKTASPGACPEFDAWHMSEWKICSELLPALALPDAMLWMMKDPANGAITGRYLDITTETSEAVRTALYYCFTGQQESRRQLIETPGLARFAGEPSHIRMDAVGRRKLVEETLTRRRIVIETAPPGEGDKKPWIESGFSTLLLTLHRDIQGGLTATARANGQVRGDGRVTLRYLLNLVDLAIQMQNQQTVRRRALPEGLVTPTAALPTREEAFFLTEEQFGIARRQLDPEQAILEYLTDCDAKVIEHGVTIDNIEYRSKTADRAGYHFRGLAGIPESVPAKKDPADCARAWLIWPDGLVERLELAEGQDHLIGIRRREYALVEEARKAAASAAVTQEHKARALFDVQRRELTAAQRKAAAAGAPAVEIPAWRDEHPDNQPSDSWDDPLARREEEAWYEAEDVEAVHS